MRGLTCPMDPVGACDLLDFGLQTMWNFHAGLIAMYYGYWVSMTFYAHWQGGTYDPAGSVFTAAVPCVFSAPTVGRSLTLITCLINFSWLPRACQNSRQALHKLFGILGLWSRKSWLSMGEATNSALKCFMAAPRNCHIF